MRPYLAVYDYDTGGIWIKIKADSDRAVETRYPVLKVVTERPSWMSDLEYNAIQLIDIDDEPPSWLTLALKEYRESHI